MIKQNKHIKKSIVFRKGGNGKTSFKDPRSRSLLFQKISFWRINSWQICVILTKHENILFSFFYLRRNKSDINTVVTLL